MIAQRVPLGLWDASTMAVSSRWSYRGAIISLPRLFHPRDRNSSTSPLCVMIIPKHSSFPFSRTHYTRSHIKNPISHSCRPNGCHQEYPALHLCPHGLCHSKTRHQHHLQRRIHHRCQCQCSRLYLSSLRSDIDAFASALICRK